MPAPGAVWSFWNTVQTVSPRRIEDEVAASFRLALVGLPEHRAALRRQILTDHPTDLEALDAENYLRELDEAPDEDTAAGFAFVVYAGGENEPVGARGENGIPVAGTLSDVIDGMLALRPDLTLAFAKRLPRFRQPACNRLIQQTSKVNATIALISALPGVFPLSAIFLPVSSVADVILLTKNQLMLVMRLAAANGQKPAYTRQMRELIGTIGSALGWRQAARELVGLVPAGVGVALKASIAYSGTMAVGKAALLFYQSGRTPKPEEIRAVYDASQAEAQAAVAELTERKTE
jgi:uncharacterized protein (DUF697 family)